MSHTGALQPSKPSMTKQQVAAAQAPAVCVPFVPNPTLSLGCFPTCLAGTIPTSDHHVLGLKGCQKLGEGR